MSVVVPFENGFNPFLSGRMGSRSFFGIGLLGERNNLSDRYGGPDVTTLRAQLHVSNKIASHAISFELPIP